MRNLNDFFIRIVSAVFIGVGFILLFMIGYFVYFSYSLKQEKEEFKEETRAYLLKTHSQEDIQSIEVVSTSKGFGPPYEAMVIFTDEPNETDYYEESESGIVPKYHSSIFKEEYTE